MTTHFSRPTQKHHTLASALTALSILMLLNFVLNVTSLRFIQFSGAFTNSPAQRISGTISVVAEPVQTPPPALQQKAESTPVPALSANKTHTPQIVAISAPAPSIP
jgi:hypothetical protein